MPRKGERQVPVGIQEKIRNLRNKRISYQKLADCFGLSSITVQNIIKKKGAYSEEQEILDDGTRDKIKRLYSEGSTLRYLSKRFSISQQEIKSIVFDLEGEEI